MVGAKSSRITPTSPEEPADKRAQHEVGDSNRGRDKETIVIPKEEEEQGGETSGAKTDVKTKAHRSDVLWAPEFRHYAGRLIHHADSAFHNIGIAFGVLQSCILSRDARVVKGCTEDLVGEIAQSLLNIDLGTVGFCLVVPSERRRKREGRQ
ncbi:hypothetical protein RHMOL_Rhmol08G0171500 [Rhododendron molle]|uniref:Uncharacterized protein n=1 Tax=Rhododendron molle TaxID=49168 RepID=A0ACC0MRB5_RHOML|nr:hypothetical protein RHMOL_Rhmol08G0171500 [Rhododendron molle]